MPLDREALQVLESSPGRATLVRRGRFRRFWLFAIILILVGTGLGWWFVPRAVDVRIAQAVKRTAKDVRVLNASGYVVARRKATVSAKTTGKITAVYVEEGMHVKSGQVVARLEDDTVRDQIDVAKAALSAARASVEQAQARLKDSSLKLSRTRSLASRNLASAASLDQAEADYRVARATLDSAQAGVLKAKGQLALEQQALDDTFIRAPFSGVVVSKDAQPGEIVSPISAGGGFTRTGICTIVDMSSLEIEVDVNEAYIQRVHEGQRALAILNAYPDWQIPAHVINIVPTADREKSTVKVRIGLDKLDPRILPEMGVQVWFLAQGERDRRAVFVPTAALHADGDKAYVFTLRDGRARRVPVTTGGEEGPDTEVAQGLSPGERVIVSSQSALRDGQRVRVAD